MFACSRLYQLLKSNYLWLLCSLKTIFISMISLFLILPCIPWNFSLIFDINLEIFLVFFLSASSVTFSSSSLPVFQCYIYYSICGRPSLLVNVLFSSLCSLFTFFCVFVFRFVDFSCLRDDFLWYVNPNNKLGEDILHVPYKVFVLLHFHAHLYIFIFLKWSFAIYAFSFIY